MGFAGCASIEAILVAQVHQVDKEYHVKFVLSKTQIEWYCERAVKMYKGISIAIV